MFYLNYKRLFRTPLNETVRGEMVTPDGISGETGDAGRVLNAGLDFDFFRGALFGANANSPPGADVSDKSFSPAVSFGASTSASVMSMLKSMVSAVTGLSVSVASCVSFFSSMSSTSSLSRMTFSIIPTTSFFHKRSPLAYQSVFSFLREELFAAVHTRDAFY